VSAVVVLLIAGLMVVFLLSNNAGPGTTAPGGANPGANSGAAAPLPTSTPAAAAGDANAAPTTEQPPRMALDEFKALYDDPAKRPLIIDVRAKDAFDAGHITGAINFPESDVDARVAELPKDKLIVAYCQ
jgi:3-mercaptopyruvate sulfurtransferase SseA